MIRSQLTLGIFRWLLTPDLLYAAYDALVARQDEDFIMKKLLGQSVGPGCF